MASSALFSYGKERVNFSLFLNANQFYNEGSTLMMSSKPILLPKSQLLNAQVMWESLLYSVNTSG